MAHHLFLLVKFLGVLGYGGGLVAAFVASAPAERRRAVHGVAVPPGQTLEFKPGGLHLMLVEQRLQLFEQGEEGAEKA